MNTTRLRAEIESFATEWLDQERGLIIPGEGYGGRIVTQMAPLVPALIVDNLPVRNVTGALPEKKVSARQATFVDEFLAACVQAIEELRKLRPLEIQVQITNRSDNAQNQDQESVSLWVRYGGVSR